MWIHAFEVCEHHFAVERVLMFGPSMFDYRVRDRVLVFTDELLAASRTCLFVLHISQIDRSGDLASAERQ